MVHQGQDQDQVHIQAEVLQEEEVEDVTIERTEERKENAEIQDLSLKVDLEADHILVQEKVEAVARIVKADLFLNQRRV